MPSIRDEVWEALNNSLDNGYDDVLTMDPKIIASELQGDKTTIFGQHIELFVRTWQQETVNVDPITKKRMIWPRGYTDERS